MEPQQQPPSKRAKLVHELDEYMQSQDAKLVQETSALKVAVQMLLKKSYCEPWSSFPVEMRHNPTCVAQALASEEGRVSAQRARWDSHVFIKLSDIPTEMLASNREVRLEALKSEFLSWESVQPTREEIRSCRLLSLSLLINSSCPLSVLFLRFTLLLGP